MTDEDIIYLLALQSVKGIGAVRGKLLLEHFGSAKAVFEAQRAEIERLEGIGKVHANAIERFSDFDQFKTELEFIHKNKIEVCAINNEHYPIKLKRAFDAPIALFYKGTDAIRNKRVVGIIGTRTNSEYGQKMCEQIIKELAPAQPLIVSGLAYGVDIIAHRAALKNNLSTIGVLAHGLDRIYPAAHQKTATEMIAKGGLLTEFKAGTNPDRENFPTRNRIVAGMCDAIVVIESAKKGGSMITAELGFSYNRDIFCVPGRVDDKRSAGCNHLIKTLKANLITSGKDIIDQLNWDETKSNSQAQRSLFNTFNNEEKNIYELLVGERQLQIDEIINQTNYSSSQVASLLLQLEMQGVVRSMPGKRYEII